MGLYIWVTRVYKYVNYHTTIIMYDNNNNNTFGSTNYAIVVFDTIMILRAYVTHTHTSGRLNHICTHNNT